MRVILDFRDPLLKTFTLSPKCQGFQYVAIELAHLIIQEKVSKGAFDQPVFAKALPPLAIDTEGTWLSWVPTNIPLVGY